MSDYGMGRIPEFDPRSRDFPVRALMATTLTPRSYTWRCLTHINQGQDGTCVAASWLAEFNARPGEHPISSALIRPTYREIVLRDDWPQNDAPDYNFGSSVLAGAKLMQSWGWITSYSWAFSLSDLVLALGYKGPAVLGMRWYEGMFDPDADGLLHLTGNVAGGHAILATGVSVTARRVRLHNSWGTGWGVNGDAYISFTDLDRLLHEQGEACIPIR